MKLVTSVKVKGSGLGVLVKELHRASGLSLKVGLLGATGGDIATVGLIHEFGAPKANIPERSFIRSTFERKAKEIGVLAERMAKKALEGQATEVSLNQIGAFLTQEIKKTITSRIPPPNAETTIARKGSDVPLVDTGQLLNSLNWSVDKDGTR